MYAIFHSPTYRERYAEFLKFDFPRLPLTSDRTLFGALAGLGAQWSDLHLLRLPGSAGVGGAGGAAVLVSPAKQGVRFPDGGTNNVDKITYHAPTAAIPVGAVSINSAQQFKALTPTPGE